MKSNKKNPKNNYKHDEELEYYDSEMGLLEFNPNEVIKSRVLYLMSKSWMINPSHELIFKARKGDFSQRISKEEFYKRVEERLKKKV